LLNVTSFIYEDGFLLRCHHTSAKTKTTSSEEKDWEVVSQCTGLDFLVLGLNLISAQGEVRLVVDQLLLDVHHQRRWHNSPRSPRGHGSCRDVCRRL